MIENTNNHLQNLTEKEINRRTFISFAVFTGAVATGIMGWRWFRGLPTTNNGLSNPTRGILGFNEKTNNALFSDHHLVRTYDKSKAVVKPRVNGKYGVNYDIDASKWQLEVVNPTTTAVKTFTIDDIMSLPKEDIVFDFKCIEGWDEIVHYGGVKLSDFIQKNNSGKKESGDYYGYVGLETPNGEYYVGLDMKSALHPQTLLCFEMNGAPLSVEHGAPLRLIIPVKYGVKNLKCIGKMIFSDTPPRDFWFENGYVYDAAL